MPLVVGFCLPQVHPAAIDLCVQHMQADRVSAELHGLSSATLPGTGCTAAADDEEQEAVWQCW